MIGLVKIVTKYFYILPLKVENGTVRPQGSSESEAEGRSSDDSQKKSGRSWKTPISSKTKTKTKSKGKGKDKDKDKDKGKSKEGAQKDPVKELRRRSTVKRSNSLDSLTMRTRVGDGVWGVLSFHGVLIHLEIL